MVNPLIVVSLFLDLFKVYIFWLYVIWQKIVNVFYPRELKPLDGEIILLTGAGNGIGKMMAHELSCVGAEALILWDIETEANEKTANFLKSKHTTTRIYAHTVDITKKDEVRLIAAKIRREIGHVTVLVNNAGIAPMGSFLDSGPYLLTQRNHGHIVTIASMASWVPSMNCSAYVATKHGVRGFIETLKTELREMSTRTDNINFTTVYPMSVDTRAIQGIELQSRIDPAYLKLTPEYVAEQAVKGFRQNYEHLFLPPSSQILPFLITILPTSIFNYLILDLMKLRIVLNKDYCLPGLRKSDKENAS